jgi:hypothetical protein
MVMARPARIIIGFRPYLSANIPQIGDTKAAEMAETDIANPE